jgi:IS5 family transposase
MVKIVLLQQWHTLSDPAAEEAVRDRLSFRRFCGLPLDMETPDHASIWRFRQTIDKLDLSTKLLAEVNRQLDALGFVIKRGTLVDATIIAGAVRRPYEGGGVNPRDPEARFTRKRDKTYFGYKAHLAVDEERAGAPGRDDPGPCARLPSGRSPHPGRRAGLLRRQGV